MNRTISPDIKSIEHLKTGFTEKNLNFYHIPSESGVFKLEIIFPNAGYYLAKNKFIPVFAMDLIMSGTNSESAHQISEDLDVLGAYVFKSSSYYNASLGVFGLNENFDSIVKLVKNAFENCIFDEKELQIYKSKKLSSLSLNQSKTTYLATESIHQLVLGENHPYAKSINKEAIEAVKRTELIDFQQNMLQDYEFILTAPQNFDMEQKLKNLGFKINALNNSSKEEVLPTENSDNERHIIKNQATQNSLRMAKILPNRNHKDYFAINLCHIILGGYFGSRLMKNIREDKGLTYGIHSSITPFRNYSLFKISSECNASLTQQVKTEIFNEIIKLQSDLIDTEELQTAKNYLMGALVRNFDGAFNISERLKTQIDLNADSRYYDTYFENIKNIDSAKIKETMNTFFDIKTFKHCIAGEI